MRCRICKQHTPWRRCSFRPVIHYHIKQEGYWNERHSTVYHARDSYTDLDLCIASPFVYFIMRAYFFSQTLLLLESLHDSRPMVGAGSSSVAELFQVFMGTGLWKDAADQQVFRCLFIPTFARCLSSLVESPFLIKGFATSSPCPEEI